MAKKDVRYGLLKDVESLFQAMHVCSYVITPLCKRRLQIRLPVPYLRNNAFDNGITSPVVANVAANSLFTCRERAQTNFVNCVKQGNKQTGGRGSIFKWYLASAGMNKTCFAAKQHQLLMIDITIQSN